MELSNYNFEKCLFDPRKHSFVKDIEAVLPSFQEYKMIKDRKKIFAWILCVYDNHSPFRLKAGNYYEKKRLAAEAVGWGRDDVGHFEKDVERYLLGRDKDINILIATYLSNLNLPQFTLLVSYLEIQYKLTQDILLGKIESHTAKTMDMITSKIEELTRTIYGSGEIDEIMEARRELYAVADKERMKLNIESIIEYIKDKGALPKDFNPYGDDYKVEELKYISDEGEDEVVEGI